MRCTRRALVKRGGQATAGLAAACAFRPFTAHAGSSFLPYILLVHCSGGWDTTMVFDNKLGVASCTSEDGAFAANGLGGISYVGHASRPAVTNFFDAYGLNAAIVNGIKAGSLESLSA